MKTAVIVVACLAGWLTSAHLQENREIADLMKKLGDPSFEVREKAEVGLIQAGPKAIPLLKEAAAKGDPEVKLRVTRILRVLPFYAILGAEGGRDFVAEGGMGRVDVVRKLKLGDLDEEPGRRIAEAIMEGFAWREEYEDESDQKELFDLRGKMANGPKLLSWVAVLMMEHGHPYVRLHGVLDIREMGAKERSAFVAKTLKDSDVYVRRVAVETLAEFEATEYIPEIRKMVDDPDPRVRMDAFEALCRLEKSWKVVAGGLESRDLGIRAKATSLLDEMGMKEALSALEAALAEERDDEVRERMESSLKWLKAMEGHQRPVKLMKSWTGHDSGIKERSYFLLTSDEAWRGLWNRHSRAALPAVDFTESQVVAIFQGRGWNSSGVTLASLTEDDKRVRLRYDDASYQTMGEGSRVATFGLFVIPRSDKTVVIEENTQGMKGGLAFWKEQARLP